MKWDVLNLLEKYIQNVNKTYAFFNNKFAGLAHELIHLRDKIYKYQKGIDEVIDIVKSKHDVKDLAKRLEFFNKNEQDQRFSIYNIYNIKRKAPKPDKTDDDLMNENLSIVPNSLCSDSNNDTTVSDDIKA